MSENDNEQQVEHAQDATVVEPLSSFADLGLRPEILQALQEMGFTAPMDVQRQTAPVVQSGRDVLVQSRTGSGKTAAFGIPMVDRLVKPEDRHVQAIVLLPTRELALQVAAELARIALHLDVTVVPVYGGAPMGRQVEQLRAGGQIVCGTPGRILDHLRRGTLKLDRVRCAVLDECDEMLSMGFQEDIERILEHTPAERQTMLFSATLPEGIRRLARRYLRNPVHLKLSADFVGVAEISHLYYTVSGGNREADLLRILAFENPGRGIVFCNTRDETGRVAEFLRSNGMRAEAISSDLSQSDREKVMKQMREGSIRFLVATDVAARGIDIDDISHVVNFSFPDSPESYIHRTGRTGRAGRHGVAVSLIGPTEVGSFYYLKLLYKIKPEERTLPSEVEIQARREGESLLALRKQFAKEPGQQWRALARRVAIALDAEHLLASLLKQHLMAGDAAATKPLETKPEPTRDDGPAHRELGREALLGAGDKTGDRGSDSVARTYPNREGRGNRDRQDRQGRQGSPGSQDRPDSRIGQDNRLPQHEPAAAQGVQEGHDNPLGRDNNTGGRGRLGAERERGGRFPDRSGRVGRRGERPERERSERERPEMIDEPVNPERLAAEQAAALKIQAQGTSPQPQPPALPLASLGDFSDPEPTQRGRPERLNRERWREGTPPMREAPVAKGDDFTSVWNDEPTRGPFTINDDSFEVDDEPEGTEARLYLNLGRKDRIRASDVAKLLEELRMPVQLNAIDVMNTHSYINVQGARAEQLVTILNGRDYNGRVLICERAKPRRPRL